MKIKNQIFNLGYIYKESNKINSSENNFIEDGQIEDFQTNLIMLNWQMKKNNPSQNKINYELLLENRFGLQHNLEERKKREYIKLNFGLTFPLFKSNNFYLNSKNAFLFGNNILENEKMGIGGSQSIRGFLENSFFSKSFSIINLENKYFFNKKSYCSIFYDIGRLHDLNNTILSFGLGLGLELETDMFSINYAIPKYNQSIKFNDAKIHFSYLLKF